MRDGAMLRRGGRAAAALAGALAVWLVVLACGASTSAFFPAPADTLWVDMTITDGAANVGMVKVTVNLSYQAGDNAGIALSRGQRLTVNGVVIRLRIPTPIARPPAGGAYTITYRDENGQVSIFAVPAPTGSFMVISPRSGAHVKVPAPVKVHEVNGSIYGAPVTGSPRTAEWAHYPFTVRYTTPGLPSGATTVVQMGVRCAPPGESTFGCGPSFKNGWEPPSGTYQISDANLPYGQGFETRGPGPGYIEAEERATWSPVASPFHAVQVVYDDDRVVGVIWTV